MIYYTHHRYIIALHYAPVDVSSNYSAATKIYHTLHHRCMVTPHYVHIDVPPNESAAGKTYLTGV